MKKYTFDEIKELNVTKILPTKMATTMSFGSCEDVKALNKHRRQVMNLLKKQKYPCLVKMSSTTGKEDYSILRCADEVFNYCLENLDSKNGFDVYLDEKDEPLIVVYGEPYHVEGEDDNVLHVVFQCVKIIDYNALDIDKTVLYKFLLETSGY